MRSTTWTWFTKRWWIGDGLFLIVYVNQSITVISKIGPYWKLASYLTAFEWRSRTTPRSQIQNQEVRGCPCRGSEDELFQKLKLFRYVQCKLHVIISCMQTYTPSNAYFKRSVYVLHVATRSRPEAPRLLYKTSDLHTNLTGAVGCESELLDPAQH